MDVVGTAVDGVGVFLVVLGMFVASWRLDDGGESPGTDRPVDPRMKEESEE
jgi:hypothetical protein